MSDNTTDRVQRSPKNGIRVVIVGAGVGGLYAALECWRKGCDVIVLEKSDQLSAIGDFFTIPPSGLTTLKYYPSMFEAYHKRVYNCTIHLYSPSGVALKSTVPEWKRPGAQHSAPDVNVSFLNRRPDFTRLLLDQLERLDVPVYWGAKVVNVAESEDEVVVKTIDGREYSCDVCIGANGIGSSIAGFPTRDVEVQDSGYAVARVAFPRTTIKAGSPAASILENVDTRPEFRTYVGDDVHLILFLTPDWVAWAFTHVNDDSAEESWGSLKDVKSLMGYLEKSSTEWSPAVLDFIMQTPNQVVDWNLRWRDGTEKWTSDGGRLVFLGDAAHAFLPTAGNGAVQAIEDANSLGECLRLGGKQNVQWATKVHNKLRFQRTSVLQQMGFLNREELHAADVDAIQKDPDNSDIGFFRLGRWIWAHDAEAYARERFAVCLASLKAGSPFTNTNLPPGHQYHSWTLESEKKRMASGIRSTLKQNGYWGL